MKRTLKLFVVTAIIVVVTAFVGVAAYGAGYDVQADALHEMGLFRGTNNGYELEKTPTRAEAAVMLVRLLGKESEAKAGAYEMPFTDVPDWAKHEVGYLYTNSLTKGTAATTYSSNVKCDAQMFATLLLRALGYSDSGGDFTYAAALEYAASIGLVTDAGSFGSFKRGEMAALSYSALFQPVKDSDGTTLLERLVADNAVEASSADKYLESYQLYQNLQAANTGNNSATSMQVSSDLTMLVKIGGQIQTLTQNMELATVKNGEDYQMSMKSTTEFLGSTQEISMYYADGWMYMDMGIMKYKTPYTFEPKDLSDLTQQSGMDKVDEPFYLIDSITKTDTGTGVRYNVVYSAAAMNDLFDSLMSQVVDDLEGAAIQIGALEMIYSCDSSGKLKSALLTGDIGLTVTDGLEATDIDMTFQQEIKILATGPSVTVTPPADLSTYETIEDPEN